MLSDRTYIFDFDSTFIQCETLDVLAEISLQDHPQKQERLNAISHITKLAMEGRYAYAESLEERFSLLPLKPEHIQQTIQILQHKITPSFLRHKDFFKKNAKNIYLFTGAFIDIVWPVVERFGLLREQVFANRLLYDVDGNIYGYDKHHPLAQDQGKVKIAHQLQLPGEVIIIGDGYNDYEVKAASLAQTFMAFTENVKREAVTQQADAIIDSLEGFFIACSLPYATESATHPKVLLLENIHPFVVQYFQDLGYSVEALNRALPPAELIEKLQGVHILGIRSKTDIPADILTQCPSLEAIGAFCIGTNHIALDACIAQGIAVYNAPFSNTRSVVELALAEIILLVRRAVPKLQALQQGAWNKSSTNAHEVRGKTLGIIGYGNIGSQLSILAEALGMHVLFYDIADKLALGNAKTCSSLEALLRQSDVVSLHIDGRKENRHFIDAKAFDAMKDGAIFLNLSRDFTVDYDALTKALASGKIQGVGCDVFPNEPHASQGKYSSALAQFENVILTPHIGGSTEEAQQHIGEYVSKNLHAFMADGASVGSVNFPQLALPPVNGYDRIMHIHHNVPGILAQINSLFSEYQYNIEAQHLKTNEKIGYVVTDTLKTVDPILLARLEQIPHTIKVRKIRK